VVSDLEDDPLSLLGTGVVVAGVELGAGVAGVDGVDDPSVLDGLAPSDVEGEVSEPSDFEAEESSPPAFDDPFLRLSFL
jgi:hypothetical protein